MARIGNNRLFWHILLWGGTWLLLILFVNNGWENPELLLISGLPILLGVLIVVVLNVQLLLPKLYFKKKIGLYILASFVLFIILIWFLGNNMFLFSELAEKHNRFKEMPELRNRVRPFGWMRFAVPLLISFIGSTIVELTHFANNKEKAVISIEKEKLDTEIKFLKSQINPHFLFNVLNNIYTLTVIKSEKAPENLLRLSEMLRYMLYDSNEGNVPLQKEIDYLENYINLASLKDSRGLNIKVNLENNQPGIMVAPLLFIPFVENAFKHSKIEDLKNGYIYINLKTTTKQIEFSIDNSIPSIVFKKDKVGGIGLTNTKHRLQLLYPNKHELKISEDKHVYSVNLKLDLT